MRLAFILIAAACSSDPQVPDCGRAVCPTACDLSTCTNENTVYDVASANCSRRYACDPSYAATLQECTTAELDKLCTSGAAPRICGLAPFGRDQFKLCATTVTSGMCDDRVQPCLDACERDPSTCAP